MINTRFRVNANPVIHRRRHRKIRRSSGINAENKEQDGENEFCTINPISNSTYENSTPSFVPLSASIQSAPPSPPHFKTPSRIVPTNYGSEIKLKLMTTEDKVLRSSSKQIFLRLMRYLSSTNNAFFFIFFFFHRHKRTIHEISTNDKFKT